MNQLLRDCVVPMTGGLVVGLLTLATIWSLAGAPRLTADDDIAVGAGAARSALSGSSDSVVLIIPATPIHAHGHDEAALEPARLRAGVQSATFGSCRSGAPNVGAAPTYAEAAVVPTPRVAPFVVRYF